MRDTEFAHLTPEQLLRALDDELSPAETALVESHVANCAECGRRFHDLGLLSVRLESLVSAMPVAADDLGRALLATRLEQRDLIAMAARPKRRAVWHATWSAAVAAGVVLVAMLSPRLHLTNRTTNNSVSGTPQMIEVAGESFVALPYSNADLPTAPHIVQMEVPVSSLADAGVVFEPVSSEQSNPDRSVLADVLLGVDGEPLGVHVIGNE